MITAKSLTVLFVACALIVGCSQPDMEPPVALILSPGNDSVVSEIIEITCSATDNIGISMVELWVDGVSSGIEDHEKPYSLDLNTSEFATGSYHVLTVRAYDESDNQSDSPPITINIDHTEFQPNPSTLYPVIVHESSYTLIWSQNQDADFGDYTVYESLSPEMDSRLSVFNTSSRIDTSFEIDGSIQGVHRYYQIETHDVWGLSIHSEVQQYYRAPRLLTAHFIDDWLCEDCGTGTIFISSPSGEILAERTWTGNADLVIDPPAGLILNSDEITVTTIRSQTYGDLTVNTMMNVPVGSDLTWKRNINSGGGEYAGNITINLVNRPEHWGYLYSSYRQAGYSTGGWVNTRLNLMYWGTPQDLYIRLNTTENGVRSLWREDLVAGEYEIDLTNLDEAGHQRMDFNGVAYQYFCELYGYEEPGNHQGVKLHLDSADEYETLTSFVDLYYPPDVFSDYQTELLFYDNEDLNYNTFWIQQTFGDIPQTLTKINADFNFITVVADQFQINTTSNEFDLINSIWRTVNGGWYQTWFVIGESSNTQYSLPVFPESVLLNYPELDRESFRLVHTSLEDYNPVAGYGPLLELLFDSSESFEDQISAYRSRVKSVSSNRTLRSSDEPEVQPAMISQYKKMPRWYE